MAPWGSKGKNYVVEPHLLTRSSLNHTTGTPFCVPRPYRGAFKTEHVSPDSAAAHVLWIWTRSTQTQMSGETALAFGESSEINVFSKSFWTVTIKRD